MVKGVLSQKIIKIDLTVLEIYPQFLQKPGFSLILHFWHFWLTLMTKKCSGGLDLNFFMYWSTKNFFVKIGAPLVQKCSALPEYSHRLKYKYHLFPFRIGEHQKECRLCTGLAIWKQERKRGKFCYDKCVSNQMLNMHCIAPRMFNLFFSKTFCFTLIQNSCCGTGEYFTKNCNLCQKPHQGANFLPTKFWGKFWQKHQF